MSLSDVPQLLLAQMQDANVRENFRRVGNFFSRLYLFTNFTPFTATFTGAVAHSKFAHNLGFLPKDVIVTSLTGTGTVTFNQSLSDSSNLDLTVTGPCTVRFIAGSFN